MKKFLFLILISLAIPLIARPHSHTGHTHYGRWDMRYSGRLGYGGRVHHYHYVPTLIGSGSDFSGVLIGTGSSIAPRSTVVLGTPVESPYSPIMVSTSVIVNNTPAQVIQPATVVERQPRWIPGHYEIRTFGEGSNMTSMNIWIPGHWE